ncbi:hypothetical protein CYMTET_18689 [Cymbomonas tetramitiformis]|uniref:Uncharacterized protein n=1 Tax=Cymbomonas tetramitiformis TaxID=36881 RepID=A0AAE0G820_9CHLO|nr:hypothetical protein CYMTET_18689 [Cymbomonas tetramitiformis]
MNPKVKSEGSKLPGGTPSNESQGEFKAAIGTTGSVQLQLLVVVQQLSKQTSPLTVQVEEMRDTRVAGSWREKREAEVQPYVGGTHGRPAAEEAG